MFRHAPGLTLTLTLVLCVLAASLPARTVGPETGLPLPRFVSLKASEANVRRGPSHDHRIDWIFTRREMPLLVIAEHGHWRRVQDRDGVGGWVHYALLSGLPTVIVDEDMLPLHAKPGSQSRIKAHLENGVIARLEQCEGDWCRLNADGYKGWSLKAKLWGIKTPAIE